MTTTNSEHNETSTTPQPQDRRAETSPINGAKSKGPKTESGKKKSSGNSLKHGFYSRDIVLASESREEHAALTAWFVETYAPTTPEEHELVIDMANARWLIRRVERHLKGLMHLEMARALQRAEDEFETCTSDVLEAMALEALSESRALENVNRMAQRFERTYYRAKSALEQGRRPHREPSEQQPPAPETPQPTGTRNEPTPASHPGLLRRLFLPLLLILGVLAAVAGFEAKPPKPASSNWVNLLKSPAALAQPVQFTSLPIWQPVCTLPTPKHGRGTDLGRSGSQHFDGPGRRLPLHLRR